MTIRGVAETEENKSMDSSYFFCSNKENAFKYRIVRNLISFHKSFPREMDTLFLRSTSST